MGNKFFRWATYVLCLFLVALVPESRAMGMFDTVGYRDFGLRIPIADPGGRAWVLQGHMCLPEGGHKPRLVVINHGSPADARERPGMALAGCRTEAVQWFLRRHYAVALFLRLGYGATGGPWTEGYNGCQNADYFQAGLETARQIATVVDTLTALPMINPEGVVVVGQSAGGWGALAYDSQPHQHVSAFIDMAGGRGGHYHGLSNSNCKPGALVAAASHFGRTASTPVLWIAANNDSFFGPNLASAMAQAFNQAGGKARFALTDAFGEDGHHLFFGRGGSRVWGPLVEAFLENTEGADH